MRLPPTHSASRSSHGKSTAHSGCPPPPEPGLPAAPPCIEPPRGAPPLPPPVPPVSRLPPSPLLPPVSSPGPSSSLQALSAINEKTHRTPSHAPTFFMGTPKFLGSPEC